jgi:hypothetical protein
MARLRQLRKIPVSAIWLLQCSKQGARAMLAEWIRNIPKSLLDRIVNDTRVRDSVIWNLASQEARRRHDQWQQVA